jgi:hypothetical protein
LDPLPDGAEAAGAGDDVLDDEPSFEDEDEEELVDEPSFADDVPEEADSEADADLRLSVR